MSSENAQHWTVPLNISVSFGTPSLASAATDETVIRKERQFAEGWLFADSEAQRDVFSRAQSRFSLDALSQDAFSWQNALNTALGSWLAYEGEAGILSTTKNSWKFTTCDFHSMDNTECFVASSPQVVLVAFRGTQQAGDWLINLNLATKRASYGYVHRGFYSAFHSVRNRLEQLLDGAVARDKKVIITGHSLGGAVATIAAAEWQGKYPVSGVYTYGQPAVGFTAFRSHMNITYGASYRRFVNDDDIVAQVPPGYRHAGKLFHFDSGSGVSHERSAEATSATDDTPTMTVEQFEGLRERMRTSTSLRDSTSERFAQAAFQEGFLPSFADHSMDRYLEKILIQSGLGL